VDYDGLPERHLPYFEWKEVPLPQRSDQERAKPSSARDDREPAKDEFEAVRKRTVTVLSNGQLAEADGQGGLLTLLVDSGKSKGPKPGPRTWAAIWVRPLWSPLSGTFTFRVEAGDGSLHCSEEFDPAEVLQKEPPRAIPRRECRTAAS
jgi:hypothetical protein